MHKITNLLLAHSILTTSPWKRCGLKVQAGCMLINAIYVYMLNNTTQGNEKNIIMLRIHMTLQ
jgi:hypothetical protein